MPGPDASVPRWRETTPHPGRPPLVPSEPAPRAGVERVLIALSSLTGAALLLRAFLPF